MKLIAILCLFISITTMGQQQTITGAFGYKLGDTFKPQWMIDQIQKTEANGNKTYKVKPPQPNPIFSTYEIMTATKEEKIIRISGMSKGMGPDEAMKVFGMLKKEMDTAYGVVPPAPIPPKFMGCEYKSGGKTVIIETNTSDDTRYVFIVYGFTKEKQAQERK